MRTIFSVLFISMICVTYGRDWSNNNKLLSQNPFMNTTNHFQFNQFNSNPFQSQNTLLRLDNSPYGKGKSAALISLAAPGVGLYMANRSIRSLILLPVCYGMVGGGAFLMIKGKKDAEAAYSSYLVEKNPELQDEYMDQADAGAERNKTGMMILAGGAAIWAAQTVWTFIYGSYNDSYRKRNSKWNNTVSSLYGGYDPITNTTNLSMTINL
ncbi:MAG: hypothetical protein WDZ35_16050 [Crocinitomicaceae bacterium]